MSEATVEAALDAWFSRPDWRGVYADGPPVRDYMRRALDAALARLAAASNFEARFELDSAA